MNRYLITAIFAFAPACDPTDSSELRDAGEVTCFEDQVAVVRPARVGDTEPLHWVCVTLDDFADSDSIDRLDAILED